MRCSSAQTLKIVGGQVLPDMCIFLPFASQSDHSRSLPRFITITTAAAGFYKIQVEFAAFEDVPQGGKKESDRSNAVKRRGGRAKGVRAPLPGASLC
ncbi:hypothetical protein PROFUN_10804 [Planoprotostelium fungivorum]|uniref:Uncharacterized protein n=1 Tax=Planoprotostelium fungivorum TaxID=1890364 RepID=A0A2P6ND08_9EUKA|nr:hypothetical protein PROFUN_10804 [Planoprotostelium fungivorum]